MKNSCDQLEQWILDFMLVVHECYAGTNFAEDRSVYAQDLAEAFGWISQLRSGAGAEIVANEILSLTTSKRFDDYWRQGDWGKREVEALEKLKASVMK